IQGWTSQTTSAGMRSAELGVYGIEEPADSVELNWLFTLSLAPTLCVTGSLDFNTTLEPAITPRTCGSKTQFFWSKTTSVELAAAFASGFTAVGFGMYTSAYFTPLESGSTINRSDLSGASLPHTLGSLGAAPLAKSSSDGGGLPLKTTLP